MLPLPRAMRHAGLPLPPLLAHLPTDRNFTLLPPLPTHTSRADAEKAYVRTTSTACLLSEPSSRVAVQLALLISNLARFDVPRPWDSLVGDLAASAGMDSPTSLESKLRSLRALKHCVRGLKGELRQGRVWGC